VSRTEVSGTRRSKISQKNLQLEAKSHERVYSGLKYKICLNEDERNRSESVLLKDRTGWNVSFG
jgi:hypothetical protein